MEQAQDSFQANLAVIDDKRLGPIPLFIGVTGHRDILPRDVTQIEEIVTHLLTEIKKSNKHTRVIVLSPLAEGADRIVARVAVKLGLELVVPLPMAEVEYVADFKTKESVDEFYRLFDASSRQFIVECRAEQHIRECCYEALAAYIVEASDLLIALWDGMLSERMGGTAKTVQFKREGLPDLYDPDKSALDPPDSGPVYHIVTPRRRTSRPVDAYSVRVLQPVKSERTSGEADYTTIFRKIDEFNAFARHKHPPNCESNYKFCSAVAANLAVRYKVWTQATLLAVFVLIGIAVGCFEIYAHLLKATWQFLLGNVAGFMLAFIVFLIARRAGIEPKYLDYRALAEAFRIQAFWKRLGINDGAADFYLRKQRGELQWIRKALRSACRLATIEELQEVSPVPTNDQMRDIAEEWIGKQLNYFKNNSKTALLYARRASFISRSLATAGVLTAVSVLLAMLVLNRDPGWNEWAIAVGASFAVASALVHNYAEKRAWAQHARDYERMRATYANAYEALQRVLTDQAPIAAVTDLFREIGREALIQNGDWLLIHRERPIDVPDA